MGETPLLLDSQRADLFHYIANSGLSPNDFSIGQMEQYSEQIVYVKYLHRVAYYSITLGKSPYGGTAFNSEFSPGSETKTTTANRVQWADTLKYYGMWLSFLKRELNAGDPWRALEEQRALAPTLVAYNQTSNRPFTVDEAGKVNETLAGLVKRLESVFPDVTEKVHNLGVQVESLKLAAQSRGRIDWTNQFVGFLIQVFLLLSATPAQAGLIWKFVKESLGLGLFIP